MKILADASLPNLEMLFPHPFSLTTYENHEQLLTHVKTHEALICRANLIVNEDLLKKTPIQLVASASSGTDHLDINYLLQRNIRVIDAKGSNATAVADYVISVFAYLLSKKRLTGNKVGVIGLGEVGSRLVQRLLSANFDVFSFDPFKEAHEKTTHCESIDDLAMCNIICVHANLHDTQPFPSRNLLDASFIKQLQAETVIINASRGGIVNEASLLKNIAPITYCTDVYNDEPNVSKDVINYATICTPHIAGHSVEAKSNAVYKISCELHQVLQRSAPINPLKTISRSNLPSIASWQNYVLNLYNPYIETHQLKKAFNIKETFLDLREAHRHRHDFNGYCSKDLEKTSQVILGYG